MDLGVAVGPKWKEIESVSNEFDFVELAIGEMEVKPEEVDFDKVKEWLEEKDLELILHLPFRQPLATTVGEFNSSVLEYLERLLVETEVKVEKAVVHANLREMESEEEKERLETQILDLKEIGEELGVEICLENVGNLDGIELFELGELLDEIDASMCFDTGHAYMEAGQEEMEEFLESYSHLVSHLHAQDTREGRDMHMAIGEGEVDFEAVGEKLQDFNGTVCLEVYSSDSDYIQLSKQKLLQHF